ncbi:hypothetical protein ES703_40453 [subsurface metagenome]
MEVAFGWCESLGNRRRLITGVNWSPGILDPFRQLDEYGDGLDDILYECEIGSNEPVVFFMHYASPRISFTDKGKTAIVLRIPREVVESDVKRVTKKWTRQRKAEKRSGSVGRRQAMKKCSSKISIKEAAHRVMKPAYLKASDDNTLPATVRQIMYAARPRILELTGRDKLKSEYFTQTLLPEYMQKHPELTWDVVFDARGHFLEPHTNIEFGIGTLGVRGYLQNISSHVVQDIQPVIDNHLYPTMGPVNRYSAILFIEKEGFMPLFQKVRLAERYDLAIMSTKGMSVIAARHLVDMLCQSNGSESVPLFVLHDFDVSGFSILGTLQRDTERYEFSNTVRVIDLGIRLEDVEKYNLVSEDCTLTKTDPVPFLKLNGATEKEIAYLCRNVPTWNNPKHSGKRVELNAFGSREFISWIESKLERHSIKKVVPDNQILEDAFRRAALAKMLEERLELFIDEAKSDIAKTNPLQLTQKVNDLIKKNPRMPWDWAINKIAEADIECRDLGDGE